MHARPARSPGLSLPQTARAGPHCPRTTRRDGRVIQVRGGGRQRKRGRGGRRRNRSRRRHGGREENPEIGPQEIFREKEGRLVRPFLFGKEGIEQKSKKIVTRTNFSSICFVAGSYIHRLHKKYFANIYIYVCFFVCVGAVLPTYVCICVLCF